MRTKWSRCVAKLPAWKPTTATVGQLVSPNQMADLPLNGRNFTDLLALAPGVVTVPASPGGGGQSSTVYGTQTNYSVSGSRPEGLQYLLDGTDIRDALDHGAGISVMGTSLGMEAIQEFSDSDQHVQRGVWRHRRGDQRGHQIGHERRARIGLRIYSQQRHGRQRTTSTSRAKNRPSRGTNSASLWAVPSRRIKPSSSATTRACARVRGRPRAACAPTSLSDLFTDSGFTPSGTGWEGLYGPTPTVVQNIFSAYPLAQSASQCPNVTNIEFEAGTGLYFSKELQIGNEDYVLGRVDYTLSPKDSLFARYTRESAYQVLPYVLTLSCRDSRKSTTNTISTSPSESGTRCRRRY